VNFVEAGAVYSTAYRRIWHEHHIVLIIADDVGSFGCEDTNHSERDVLHTNRFANGVRRLEEFLRDSLPDDANLGRVVDVLVREESAQS